MPPLMVSTAEVTTELELFNRTRLATFHVWPAVIVSVEEPDCDMLRSPMDTEAAFTLLLKLPFVTICVFPPPPALTIDPAPPPTVSDAVGAERVIEPIPAPGASTMLPDTETKVAALLSVKAPVPAPPNVRLPPNDAVPLTASVVLEPLVVAPTVTLLAEPVEFAATVTVRPLLSMSTLSALVGGLPEDQLLVLQFAFDAPVHVTVVCPNAIEVVATAATITIERKNDDPHPPHAVRLRGEIPVG